MLPSCHTFYDCILDERLEKKDIRQKTRGKRLELLELRY